MAASIQVWLIRVQGDARWRRCKVAPRRLGRLAETAIIVIPVLTPLLTAVGKEVASWTDCSSRLRVNAVNVVDSALCAAYAGRSSQRDDLV